MLCSLQRLVIAAALEFPLWESVPRAANAELAPWRLRSENTTRYHVVSRRSRGDVTVIL